MFLETIHTPGLAALSYVVGDGLEAAVIDPRRDIEVYLEHLHRHGAKLRYIFETHRNEDFVVGSRDLAARTGAQVLHGEGLDFGYGSSVSEGRTFEVGGIRLKVLRTPGHTDESISLVLYHDETGDSPLGVFTGDALFVGDVGRTDFHPDRLREDAATLYDTLHDKLLPLGDQCVLYPAHGAGSVCGESMADRNFSTLGYERVHNPLLQLHRDAFIERKVNEEHVQPPYFRKMEEVNLRGPEVRGWLPEVSPIGPDALRDRLGSDQVIDVRSPQAFAGSHVPGSLCLPEGLIPGYAGWLLDYETPITLIVEDDAQVGSVVRALLRLGYERIEAYLGGGVDAWETSGNPVGQIPAVSVEDLKRRVETQRGQFTLLDVRKPSEWKEGRVEGATRIFLGELRDRLDDLPSERPVVTFCGSGKRAAIAASILRRAGVEDVENSFGSMAACRAAGCPMVDED